MRRSLLGPAAATHAGRAAAAAGLRRHADSAHDDIAAPIAHRPAVGADLSAGLGRAAAAADTRHSAAAAGLTGGAVAALDQAAAAVTGRPALDAELHAGLG